MRFARVAPLTWIGTSPLTAWLSSLWALSLFAPFLFLSLLFSGCRTSWAVSSPLCDEKQECYFGKLQLFTDWTSCAKNTSDGGGESESDGAGIGGGGGFLDFFSGWSSTPSSELLLLLSLSLAFLAFSFFLFSSSSFSLSRSRRSSSASSFFRRSSSSLLRSSSLFFHSLMQSVSLSLWKHKTIFTHHFCNSNAGLCKEQWHTEKKKTLGAASWPVTVGGWWRCPFHRGWFWFSCLRFRCRFFY